MALRITIDLFSGRPNPSVVVTGMEEREIRERLGTAATAGGRARTTKPARPSPPVLGYRGLVVEPLADDEQPGARAGTRRRAVRAAAPAAALRVARGIVQRAGLAAAVRDPGIEDHVLSPAGPFHGAGFAPRFFDHLAHELARSRRAQAVSRASRVAAGEPDGCACAPLWEPEWWNDGGPHQLNNNCYNYATNYRTDTYAQPGKANGAIYAAMTIAAVSGGALADALLAAPVKNKCPKKGHLVALFLYEYDFHWYRKQRSGYWTHKPGGDLATQVDNANALIADPRTADRGPYTDFGGFLIVMPGHVKII